MNDQHTPSIRSARSAAARREGSLRRRAGFTLIELIAASVIASILAGAATVSIRRLADGRDRSAARQAAVESVHSITRLVARDLANIVRDTTLLDTIVRIEDTPSSGSQQTDEVLLFCRSMRPVRPEQQEETTYRESGIHEVHYRLKPDEEVVGVLWRRTDPIVDENYQGGGVAVPLALNVYSLDFEAFDGTTWQSTWDSDSDGLPHALRVTCQVVVPDTGAIIAARRTVAIDRIPLPFDAEVDETYDTSMDVVNLEFGEQEEQPEILFDFGGGGGGNAAGGGGRGGGRRRGGDRQRDGGGDRPRGGGDRSGGDGGGQNSGGGGRPRGGGG